MGFVHPADLREAREAQTPLNLTYAKRVDTRCSSHISQKLSTPGRSGSERRRGLTTLPCRAATCESVPFRLKATKSEKHIAWKWMTWMNMVPWKTTFLYEQGVNSTSVSPSRAGPHLLHRCSVSRPQIVAPVGAAAFKKYTAWSSSGWCLVPSKCIRGYLYPSSSEHPHGTPGSHQENQIW